MSPGRQAVFCSRVHHHYYTLVLFVIFFTQSAQTLFLLSSSSSFFCPSWITLLCVHSVVSFLYSAHSICDLWYKMIRWEVSQDTLWEGSVPGRRRNCALDTQFKLWRSKRAETAAAGDGAFVYGSRVGTFSRTLTNCSNCNYIFRHGSSLLLPLLSEGCFCCTFYLFYTRPFACYIYFFHKRAIIWSNLGGSRQSVFSSVQVAAIFKLLTLWFNLHCVCFGLRGEGDRLLANFYFF